MQTRQNPDIIFGIVWHLQTSLKRIDGKVKQSDTLSGQYPQSSMKQTTRFKTLLVCGFIAFLGCASNAKAVESESNLALPSNESTLSLRGFGTLGVARSTTNQAEFVRDLSQPRGISDQWSGRIDSVIGIQANWQATPEVELVAQVVSRYRYDESRSPEVMWAFAKWDPDPRVSFRAGRIGADFMMLADSRLVGYSYLTVRPSSDFFGPLFFSHFNGVDANLTLPLSHGLLRGKLFTGATQEKATGAPGIWDTSGSPVYGFVLDYQTGPWLLRANTANIRFSNNLNFDPLTGPLRAVGTWYPSAMAAADFLTARDTTTRFYSLGLVYDNGPMQVQGMVNTIRQETGVFQNSQAAYLLAGYRFGSITPYVGVSRWVSTLKPYSTGLPTGQGLDQLITSFDQVLTATSANRTTYTLGARWDVQQNVALKMQLDALSGSAESRFPYARSEPGWNGRTNVFSVTLDFVF